MLIVTPASSDLPPGAPATDSSKLRISECVKEKVVAAVAETQIFPYFAISYGL